MRKLITLVLLASLIGCGGELEEKKDLSGTWTFSQGAISGSLILTRFQDFEYVPVGGSFFIINGVTYDVVVSSSLTVIPRTGGDLGGLDLATGFGYTDHIRFREGNVNKSYTKISFTLAHWGIGCDETCETEGEEETIILIKE